MRQFILIVSILAVASATGCMRPFEPVKLEDVEANEEAFLIPTQGDVTKQSSSKDGQPGVNARGEAVDGTGQVNLQSPEALRKHVIYRKQVQIPHRWVQTGREWFGMPNGKWIPSSTLMKVDRSPITCEWTADTATGTSKKNEAIWVMTADQVEFSTGWTCTARIDGNNEAVKFLTNYPNGSLEQVMNREVRAFIQTAFGLEVTDLPMESLRLKATPHIQAVVASTKEFFKARGITITNLGISGGFVYKNKTVGEKLVEVFNAEQAKAIAAAGVAAQEETNKKVKMEAEAKAAALLTARKAEAEGILAVAEARRKEVEVVKDNPDVYMTLRRVELEKEKLAAWNGAYPTFFMAGGSESKTPDMLLSVPAFGPTKPKEEAKK